MAKSEQEYQTSETQTLRASLDIYSQNIILTEYLASGKTRRVFVSPAEAASVFGNKSVTAWFDCEPGAVKLGVSGEGTRTAAIVRKSAKTKLIFELGRKKELLTIRLPSLLAVVSGTQKGYDDIKRVFAFWGELKVGTRLYLPPLPNMIGSDGDVCMGNINMKLYRGLPAAVFFERAFLGTAFNQDNAAGSLKKHGHYKNIRDFLKRCPMSKMRTYLKQAGTYGTELLQNI